MKKKDTKYSSLKKFAKNQMSYIVALSIFLFFLFFGFTNMAEKAEYNFYDLALRIKPEVNERDDILLLNVDDIAIEKVGSWPWTRDVLADVLIRFKELGGKTAVFDIEYLTPSLQAINKEYIEEELPKDYEGMREEMKDYIESFSSAIKDENIALKDVEEEGQNMSEYLDQKLVDLSNSLSNRVFRDNDTYFANAIGFFGNTFLTINTVEINLEDNSKEAKDYAFNNLLYTNIEDKGGYIKKETLKNNNVLEENNGISPAILPLIQKAKGAGFPNVVIDSDGVRRRVPLLSEYNGKYVGQLVFSPLITMLNPDKIIREKGSLTLKNVATEEGPKDIIIPLDENGNLLINWLKKKFVDEENMKASSFKSLSTYSLIYADELEKNLMHTIDEILTLGLVGYEGDMAYYIGGSAIKREYEALNEFKKELLEGTSDGYYEYFTRRAHLFSSIDEFLSGIAESELLMTFEIAGSQVSGEYSKRFEEVINNIKQVFANARIYYKEYVSHMDEIKRICYGSFAIIGYSGVGTSDLGTNPFWNSYPNVGTHANVYNTIMEEAFIKSVPRIYSIIISFIFLLLSAWLLKKIQKGYIKIIFGIALAIAMFVGFIALFAFLHIYVQIFMPLAGTVLTFIFISFLSFIFSEKEKSFLRQAFAVYLSDDVVKQIVLDPSQLALGGVTKRITALFTDIKSFSTLSEKISPEHLVSVLNIYLTRMSDIILDEKGTIDKYIGDAIVSFFGAPLDLEDNAIRACMAALKMKEAEDEINASLYETGKIPMPIKTRIGINTGNMVVGNMGTEKKMNYTIMGNDVNLAARLEGVNKKYGTWILISESTWNDTKGIFLGRRLDRVRVVGINTPVQLYNVMAVKNEANEKEIKLVEVFERGISLYRERNYKEALQAFKECKKIKENDEPTNLYIERMEELCSNPELAASHDDIVNMTSK